ncbi:hypothetical protein N7457_004640 [Penicillium paradoxum]|uniref:uncharacterized protein n=1 Tax=Penicillium paradoxum TaxID=176176 RepID=UPI0025499D7C|nr:uncharacterized protein N7457_004640 [Penicillium paradoxum]KAJ5782866.1 hypothetical protein N7457_004640 [Penicillium paradoxum]
MGWVYNATPEVEAASQYHLILGVCLSLTLLMVFTVSLRLYIRARAGRLAAPDYVMVVSMIFSIIYSALCISREPNYLPQRRKCPYCRRKSIRTGTSPETTTSSRLLDIYQEANSQLNYAGRPFYQIGIAGFKASLCLSYLRLISGTSKSVYRTIIWVVIVVSTLGHIAGALVLIFNCTPVQRAWNARVPGTCLPVGATFYGLATFTIIADVTIIVLPIPLLLGLKIRTAQKAGVVCLFLLGLFTTMCSVMRLTQIQRIAFGDGNSTMLVLWGTIEFNVGNIITCAPYLAPLLKRFVRGLGSTNDKKTRYMYYYGSRARAYGMDNLSKDPHCHLQVTASGPAMPRRTGSEERILARPEPDHGGIEMTVEYSVSLEGGPTK